MTVQLRDPVGEGRPNHPEDVALVQLLLGERGELPVGVDGYWGGETLGAVQAFQVHHLGFTDGVVAPGDLTFHRLLGPPDPDPRAEGWGDLWRRALVLHRTGHGIGAGIGEVPEDYLRPTTDGLGWAAQWIVDGGAYDLYSHPRYGTWEVAGLILGRYREIGSDSSALGVPISGERAVPPGAVGWFEHGRITYDASTGTVSESYVS